MSEALDTISAQFRRAERVEAEVERLRGERDIALAVSLGGRLCISEQHKLLEAEVERLEIKWRGEDAGRRSAQIRAQEAEAEVEWLRETAIAEHEKFLAENRDALEQEARAEKAEAQLAELQRKEYGTPCNCDAWIETCRAAEVEVARLRAFAHRLLIVHEMRDEKTADAILDAALRGEGEK